MLAKTIGGGGDDISETMRDDVTARALAPICLHPSVMFVSPGHDRPTFISIIFVRRPPPFIVFAIANILMRFMETNFD